MERETKVVYNIAKVDNMVVTDAICGIFTNINGIFNARLLFGVPIYSIPVQQMDNAGLISSISQICHKVFINKARYKDWFDYRRLERMR